MKNFWKKTAAGLLALLIVAGGTPIQPLSKVFEKTAITASAASTVDVPCSVDTSSFDVITDVKILGADKAGDMEKLVSNYKSNGWTVIEQDLNEGAKGWYIYLAYKTATVTQQSDLSNAIRDIIIVNGSAYGNQTTLSGIESLSQCFIGFSKGAVSTVLRLRAFACILRSKAAFWSCSSLTVF